MRRALIPVVLAGAMLAACGGEDDGRGDLAQGKLFDPGDVTSCLRDEGFSVEPQRTDIGVDLTVRRPDGRNSIDVGVERSATDAAEREKAWRKLAEDAGVDNAQAYYFRYGNLILGYERAPSERFRQKVERCLA